MSKNETYRNLDGLTKKQKAIIGFVLLYWCWPVIIILLFTLLIIVNINTCVLFSFNLLHVVFPSGSANDFFELVAIYYFWSMLIAFVMFFWGISAVRLIEKIKGDVKCQ